MYPQKARGSFVRRLTQRSSGLTPFGLAGTSFHSGPGQAKWSEPLNANVRLLKGTHSPELEWATTFTRKGLRLRKILSVVIQSVVLAVLAAAIAFQLQELAGRATRNVELPELHRLVMESSPVFLAFAGLSWLLAEVKLLRMAWRNELTVSGSDVRWFSVFFPMLIFMYVGIGLMFIAGVGLVAAIVAHVFVGESISCMVGVTVCACIVGWLFCLVKK